MTPSRILEELSAEADIDEKEAKAFHDLRPSAAYVVASRAMSRMMLVCGIQALDDGKTEYWSGVRDGLQHFFDMTEGAAMRADRLIADIEYKEANMEPYEDDDEEVVDLSQAISSLGSSPL